MSNGIINGKLSNYSGITGTVTARSRISGNIMATVLKGLSAYDVAVQEGYTGTEEEWLEYIRGKSAYELAVIHGFEGTEEEWIESLSATVELGTVTTGSQVSITNSGTNKNAVLDFILPPSDIDSLSQNDTIILNCGSATEVI